MINAGLWSFRYIAFKIPIVIAIKSNTIIMIVNSLFFGYYSFVYKFYFVSEKNKESRKRTYIEESF